MTTSNMPPDGNCELSFFPFLELFFPVIKKINEEETGQGWFTQLPVF